MAQDTATPAATPDCEVMASVDDADDSERLIIAELCREEAWLATPTEHAVLLSEWQ